MANKKKFRVVRLSKKIVSLTIFFTSLFLVLVMGVLSFFYVSRQIQVKAESAQTSAQSTITQVNEFINQSFSRLEGLATHEKVIDYLLGIRGGQKLQPSAGEDNYFNYLAVIHSLQTIQTYAPSDAIDFIFIASPENCSIGNDGCYLGSNNTVSNAEWTLTSRPWYLGITSSAEQYILTAPYIDQRTGDTTISMIAKVEIGNQTIGYVGFDLFLPSLMNIIQISTEINSNKEVLLIHRNSSNDYRLLASTLENKDSYIMKSETEILALDEQSGLVKTGLHPFLYERNLIRDQFDEVSLFEKAYDAYLSEIANTDWMVVILIPSETLLAVEWTFAALLGGVFVLLLGVTFLIANRVNQTLAPIGDLLTTIDEIKKGNFDSKVHIQDNTELKQVGDAINMMTKEIGEQMNLVYQSYLNDQITGLKNRRISHEQIENDYFSPSEKTAVLLIDVDNLKNINVTKGQTVGDEILKAFADRLKKSVRYPDAVYFNGSNEFIFIMPKVKSLDLVESEIYRVFDKFREPISIKNLKIEVRSNIGVAVYPYDGKTMEDLVKKCDTALFKAKEAGRGKFVFYNDQITREVLYKAQINEQLSDALNKNQLYLKYQPLIDNRSEIYGFEALVRWNSPTLGEISPQVFIANAEESQLIIPIGNWILREACITLSKINALFQKPFVMSVNVSPVQIVQKDFIDILRQILRETDIDPHHLVLEITENVVMESSYLLDKTIDTIHEIGAKIALDDFGTGYASLTYLRKLPFDNLKIDKSFVDGIFASKKEHSIIGTIVELVHNLNMKVVAEGVESRRQYEFLKQISTDVFQGFLFSKPLVYEDLVQYIDQFYKVARTKRIDVFANKDYKPEG